MSVIETALRTALNANASLMAAAPGGVHQDIAPKAVNQPFVVYSLMGSVNDYTLAPSQRSEDDLYMVKGVATTITAADAIAALIETVMGTNLTISGMSVVDQIRVERIAYRDITVEGQDYWHRGGVWRLTLDHA